MTWEIIRHWISVPLMKHWMQASSIITARNSYTVVIFMSEKQSVYEIIGGLDLPIVRNSK
jgi:hypothetical protein